MEVKNRYRFVIQGSVVLVRACIGLVWASAGPLIPLLMQQFHINRGEAGWFASSAPLAIAAVSIPAGIIMSRYSLKKTFAVGAILQAGGILAPLVDSYVWVVVTRIVFAIGTAITVPIATAIAAEWFSNRELPFINGITMSFISLANAVAYVLTVPLATIISWNAPIAIYGAVALTAAVGWIVLGRDRRADKRAPLAKDASASNGNGHSVSIREVLTRRSTLVLALGTMGMWALGNAMGSWLPNYYNEVFGMPLEKASSIAAIITGTGAAACFVGGMLPVRLGRRKPFLIVPGIFMGAAALSAVMFNVPVLIFVSVALFGIFSSVQSPSLFTIPMELPNTSPRQGALIISVMQTGGNLGNFLGPLFVGYLADMTGSYLPGFIVCAVFSLSLLAAGVMLPETGPKAKRVPAPQPEPAVLAREARS